MLVTTEEKPPLPSPSAVDSQWRVKWHKWVLSWPGQLSFVWDGRKDRLSQQDADGVSTPCYTVHRMMIFFKACLHGFLTRRVNNIRYLYILYQTTIFDVNYWQLQQFMRRIKIFIVTFCLISSMCNVKKFWTAILDSQEICSKRYVFYYITLYKKCWIWYFRLLCVVAVLRATFLHQ